MQITTASQGRTVERVPDNERRNRLLTAVAFWWVPLAVAPVGIVALALLLELLRYLRGLLG